MLYHLISNNDDDGLLVGAVADALRGRGVDLRVRRKNTSEGMTVSVRSPTAARLLAVRLDSVLASQTECIRCCMR